MLAPEGRNGVDKIHQSLIQKKKMRVLNILFVLSLVIIFISCEDKSWIKYLKTEYIPKSSEGKIEDIELGKGSILGLKMMPLSGKEEDISIHTDFEILMQIKKGDYFKKIANSNKCIIERGDSIIYIDCYRLTDQERDSLGKIEEWKLEEKNHWESKKK